MIYRITTTKLFLLFLSAATLTGALNSEARQDDSDTVDSRNIKSESYTKSAIKNKPILEPNNLARQAFLSGDYRGAYLFSQQAIKRYKKDNSANALSQALSNLASTQLYIGSNDAALKLYLESLSIARVNNNVEGIERALNNISGVYLELNNFTEAHDYLSKLPVFNNIKRPIESVVIANIGMGRVLYEQGKLTEAKAYLGKAKNKFSNASLPFYKVYWYMLDADIKSAEQGFDLALLPIEKALEITTKRQFSGLDLMLLNRKAYYYLKQKKYNEARVIALKIVDQAKKLNLAATQLGALKQLFEIEKTNKKFALAIEYQEKAQVISEKISGEKIQTFIEIAKLERNIAETEEQLRLSLQQKNVAELQLKNQQQKQITLVMIIILVSGLIIFWLYRRANKRELIRQKRLNDELIELDKLKDRILTNTSHELRTPLNGIVGLSEIILSEYSETISKDLIESVELIGKSGTKLTKIVNDILDFAQLKANKTQPNLSSFNLIALLKEVIVLCQPRLEKNHVKVKLEETTSEINVYQDELRVQQILFNLIGNAVKFTERGSINVKCEQQREYFLIVIKDTGIGIPENKIERVFEGFEQVNQSDNREHSGSGLGLAICKELATILGGEIKIQSTLGQGTRVSLKLPLNY